MIVIVIGMHRSGTSAVAGILHLNGIAMGSEKTFKPKPLPQNPKGFYENYDFRKINDQILKQVGYKVKSFDTDIPFVHASDRTVTKMGKLTEKQVFENTDWGWKDPRTCLTLSEWLTLFEEKGLLEETKVVFTTRSASAVAESLRKRNELHIDNGLMLWRLYHERALEALEQFPVPRFHFSYENLLNDSHSVCSRLFQFLGKSFETSMVGRFIDPDLNRSELSAKVKLSGEMTALSEKLHSLSSV